jgi:cell division protein FtsQ
LSGLSATLARRRPLLPVLSARLRRRLLALALACLALSAGYWFWLRDSSLVAVDDVGVAGLTSSDAERIRMALQSTARGMTTLHVDMEALERAVSAYPVVRGLEVETDFPHGMRIRVIEHRPAALAVGDGGRLPVAADGTLLRGLPVEGRLPTIDVEGAFGRDRLADAEARAAAAVAGAAPGSLRTRVELVERRSEEGLVAELRDGPELIFGDARRARAKWAAAARVLADPEARGASYIDVRIPGRPAAGGLPAETVAPVAPAGVAPSAGATTTQPTTPVDPATGAGDPGAAGDPTGTTPGAPTTPTTPTAPAAPTTPTSPTTPTTEQPQAPATAGAEGGATAPTVP